MGNLLKKLAARGQKIEDFDALELAPMQRHVSGNVLFESECDDWKAASFYTVFGHLKSGGRDDFQDFWLLLDAETYVAALIARWPHLAGEEIE